MSRSRAPEPVVESPPPRVSVGGGVICGVPVAPRTLPEGVELADSLGEVETLADSLGVGLGLSLADSLGVGLGLALALALGDADSLWTGSLGEALSLGLTESLGEALSLGEADSLWTGALSLGLAESLGLEDSLATGSLALGDGHGLSLSVGEADTQAAGTAWSPQVSPPPPFSVASAAGASRAAHTRAQTASHPAMRQIDPLCTIHPRIRCGERRGMIDTRDTPGRPKMGLRCKGQAISTAMSITFGLLQPNSILTDAAGPAGLRAGRAARGAARGRRESGEPGRGPGSQAGRAAGAGPAAGQRRERRRDGVTARAARRRADAAARTSGRPVPVLPGWATASVGGGVICGAPVSPRTLPEGCVDGWVLGCSDGTALGWSLGGALGWSDGLVLGWSDGLALGCSLGLVLGWSDGAALGCSLSTGWEGCSLGWSDGLALGGSDGLALGCSLSTGALALGLVLGFWLGGEDGCSQAAPPLE